MSKLADILLASLKNPKITKTNKILVSINNNKFFDILLKYLLNSYYYSAAFLIYSLGQGPFYDATQSALRQNYLRLRIEISRIFFNSVRKDSEEK